MTPTTQQDRVETIMRDGTWRSLPEIVAAIRARFDVLDSESAVSARLRDATHRGWTKDRRIRRKGHALREYRLRRADVPAGHLFDNRVEVCNP